jgi:hypothetical protein
MSSQSAPDKSAASHQPHLASPEDNPSFTKGVFLGEIREDLVFPFPTLSSDERESLRMVLDTVRSFATSTSTAHSSIATACFPTRRERGCTPSG